MNQSQINPCHHTLWDHKYIWTPGFTKTPENLICSNIMRHCLFNSAMPKVNTLKLRFAFGKTVFVISTAERFLILFQNPFTNNGFVKWVFKWV